MIATAVALPVAVVLAFVFTAGHTKQNAPDSTASGPLPAVTVAPPPAPGVATQEACVKVFAGLPVQLGDLAPRKTDTDSSFVAAWGDPAIVFRCGVTKSAVFGTPQAADPIDVNGVIWQPDPQQKQTVYTTIDRKPYYVDLTVPAGQAQPLDELSAELAAAINAIPQTCTATDSAGNAANSKLPICS
ncbi:DUF3515 domain-containing protein [Jatrophihabitans sp. DSM 45814]